MKQEKELELRNLNYVLERSFFMFFAGFVGFKFGFNVLFNFIFLWVFVMSLICLILHSFKNKKEAKQNETN